MIFTKQTGTYNLSQWESSDRILMEDFNADNAKVEQALVGLAGQLVPITEQLGKLGNCQVYTTAYVGNDGSSKSAIIFPAKPIIVMVSNPDGTYRMICWQGMLKSPLVNYAQFSLALTWSGNALSWYYDGNTSACLNRSDSTYQVVALLDMSTE